MIVLAKKIEESIFESTMDGEGYRIVIFMSGCPHHCKNCHNPVTWNKEHGTSYEIEEIYEYVRKKLETGIFDGITLSGGDPYVQSDEVLKLVKKLKETFKDLDVWSYTGYLYEDVKDNALTKELNALIDGKFVEELKFPKKKYRGSNNQVLYYLDNGNIIKKD